MSTEQDKFNHSKRLHKEESAIHKQQKIAKTFGAPEHQYEGHRYAKHHAMNCGNPKCIMCGNPRKTWKELTAQEKRQQQEMDIARMRHSNGILPDDQEDIL